jgi:ParB-like chromosome segregation protein Spo0J
LETKFKVRFSPIQEIPIGVLKENPDNAYPPLTGVEFEDLVADIKKMGVVVPLIVRKDNVVISGHNRLRASKRQG